MAWGDGANRAAHRETRTAKSQTRMVGEASPDRFADGVKRRLAGLAANGLAQVIIVISRGGIIRVFYGLYCIGKNLF